MKVVVNKCRYTGKLFEDDDKYKKHLTAIRKDNKRKREYERLKNSFEDWLAKEKLNITDVSMIADWILKNQRLLMDSYNAIHCDREFSETTSITNLVFNFDNIRKIGNTHSCPRGGVTNWYRKDDAPLYYIGCSGRAMFKTHTGSNTGKSHASVTDLLKMIDIHTCGGGVIGSGTYSYSVDIFLSDWPAIEEQYIVDKLKGTV